MTLRRFLFLTALLVSVFAATAQTYNNIEFIENKGQWDSRVKYKGDVSNGAFFIRNAGFTVLQHNQQDILKMDELMHGVKVNAGKSNIPEPSFTLHSHAYTVDFVGASPAMQVVPDKSIPSYNNYFIGNDPSKWAGNCRMFQAVTLKNVYDNIDVRYYTDNNTLKYDIIVKPGGDVKKIALKYEGADKLQVKNKQLLIGTSLGDLKEAAPYSYQTGSKEKSEIGCKYSVKNNIVTFDIKDYDHNSTLVIDPTIIFCSFSGSTSDNWGFTATYGPDGSMFGGGIVFGNGFPTSPGAFETVFQGGAGSGFDMGIIKLSPNGNNRVYATYIGGNGNEQPHSLIVNSQGNLILAGRSNSSNYPLLGAAGQEGSGGNFDIVVTELNAAGTALIGSKKIGGSSDDGVNISPARGLSSLQRNYGDDGRSEVTLDGAGNIYVASSTQSNNFPSTVGVFQKNFAGGLQDGVLLKFNANLSTMLFASYLGGSANDAAYVLSIAPNGDIYVAGGTESSDFIGNHAGTIGPNNHVDVNNNPTIDGFVAQVNSSGSTIIRSAYIGTSSIDQVFGIQFDKNGFPYIMGQTTGSWPHINASYYDAGGKQFIAKLQPDLSAYVYSTAFGTGSPTPNISPIAFLVDRCENVYISGWGGFYENTDPFGSSGTTGLTVTPDAFKSTTDGKDFYFFVLRKDAAGTTPLFASFFGENNSPRAGGDHVDGGTSRFDKNGVIYQAVCANCNLDAVSRPVFPTTPGAWATVNNGGGAGCNLAMIKIAFNLAGVGASVLSSINGVPRDTSGCLPLTVTFNDSIRNAESYIWDFGDGSPPVGPLPAATGYTQNHTYNAVGTYQVMLIAIDPTTCNVRDTSYTHIRVGNIQAFLDFNPVKLDPCDQFSYRFDNLSTSPLRPVFGAQSFIWDFGDGSPQVTTGSSPVTHSYTGPGTYNVRLYLNDTNYCNYPDSLVKILRVAANVKAQFNTAPVGCLPYNAVFENTTLAGQSFEWDFGDNSPISTQTSPTHLYTIAGTYTIRLVANDPNTCNKTDTTRFTITVYDKPVANFSFAPDPPVFNTPTTFTNLSSPDAVRFKWDYGDGDTLLTTSRLPVVHQYNATGTFNACLTAYNVAGCDSTICKPVKATILPLVDVPNAFTPQSGDVNNTVLVRGFGIAKMQFTIWNRWGQKVFETANRLQGWDGKVKGVVQPMDVYVYTLSVEFFDGTKTTKKGDITLIR